MLLVANPGKLWVKGVLALQGAAAVQGYFLHLRTPGISPPAYDPWSGRWVGYSSEALEF